MSGNLAVLEDVLAEGTDGQYVEVDLLWPNPETGELEEISTGAITAIVGTLRSLDTEETLFTAATLTPGGASRGSYPGDPGVFRVTFTAADMAAKGSREQQTRELTLTVTHSGGKVFNCAVRFHLGNLRDVA